MNNASYSDLIAQVQSANETLEPLCIHGGGSKHFYGHQCVGMAVNMTSVGGIIDYEPSELVITARAGTLLSEIESVLEEENQMLAFDPPRFGENTTIGGVVAAGLSGPGRPYTGAVRDYVLGIRCLTGQGAVLKFGGQVMKNVAGYDISRLMTGAMGTLGILLEISLKVLPRPEIETGYMCRMDFVQALNQMNMLARQPLPLSAAAYDGEKLLVRLSGRRSAVESAKHKLNMEDLSDSKDFWSGLRDQNLEFFSQNGHRLWRISVPATAPGLNLSGDWFIDWGGAQRWLISEESSENVRQVVTGEGGHATIFKRTENKDEIFHPLPPALFKLHQNLKYAFDPNRIFNPGKMYKEF